MFSLNPDWFLNPYPWYESLRRTSPVHRDGDAGLWGVFRYEGVERVLSDYRRFSSHFGVYDESGEPASPNAASRIGADPPSRTNLRTIVSGAFTPRATAGLEPWVREITGRLLDRVAPRGAMDVVSDLAGPLPVTVTAEMLGIPAENRAHFKAWSDVIVGLSSQFGSGDERASRLLAAGGWTG